MGQLQFFKEAWHPLVDHSYAVATGRLSQCAPKPGFADAAGTGDDQITLVGDPSASKQVLEQRFIEATACAVIDIFRAGANMAQPGSPHAGLEPLCFSACDFTVNEQAKPFSVAEISSSILHLQFGKGFGHAVCSATPQNVRMATSRFMMFRRGLIDFPAVVAGGGRWVIFEMRNERQCRFC
jgi:hypothetical protein